MMSDLPPPPVAADVDLRGMPWMPLDTQRLLDSDLFALATAEEFRAAVVLWCKAWQQVPAGSLPSDDRVLAHLSGTGARWNKVRAMALRGFVLCNDGRLYHSVIVEKVGDAWAERLRNRDKQRKWREKSQLRIGNKDGDVTVTKPVTQPLRNAGEGEGEREGLKKKESQSTEVRCVSPPADRSPTGSRLTREWTPPDDLQAWATDARPDLSVTEQIERFRDYWCAIPGAKGRKTDWPATWRNWIRGQHAKPGTFAAQTIDYDRVARMANLTDNEERTHAPE